MISPKAPMPPWWVEREEYLKGKVIRYLILGGPQADPTVVCHFDEHVFSNAKELADLIVQRTKQ